ncbi:alcohol dehydrogenase catalytic domain-containing protein [Nonomuraea sp. NPDC050451]|uniref:alcohol dehydrogenase catalytic domain-containing protein n=1 Tax=Nonomuraea sp. NPDC050451 TaxID=3364364 RepID=UPI0037AA388A
MAKQYGPPVFPIDDHPVPEPGPVQLQVRARAAAINPADLLLADGTVRDLVPLDFPHIPGTDFAGTMTTPGPMWTASRCSGSAPRRRTRRTWESPRSLRGAMAEYAVVTVGDYLAKRPDALCPKMAPALPSMGMTGLPVVEADEFEPGEGADDRRRRGHRQLIAAGGGHRQRRGADTGRVDGGHRDRSRRG